MSKRQTQKEDLAKDAKSKGQRSQRPNKRSGNGKGNSRTSQRRGKEAELNIPLNKINSDDLKSLYFSRSDKGANDDAWYNNQPAIIENVARLAFQLAEGSPFLPIDTAVKGSLIARGVNANEIPSATAKTYFPGIMRLNIIPCYGRSEDHTSSLNISALETFTVLRNAASGTMVFDQNDVMINIAATDSAYMLHQWLNRGYKCAFAVDYQNQYLPDALLAAMGINPNIRQNLANYEAAINYLVVKLAKINVPDVFDIIHRHAWLFANVYKDSDGAKAQEYLFNPSGLWVFMEAQEGEVTRLQYSPMRTLAGKDENSEYIIDTVEDIYTLIDTIMNPLLGSQDFGDINGRIAKAYGPDKMVKISYAEKNQPLEIVYNQEVLTEIENATIMGRGHQKYNGLYLVQKTDDVAGGPYLVSYPTITVDPDTVGSLMYAYTPALKRLINMHTSEVGPLEVAVATRFTCSVLPVNTGTISWNLCVGSEIVESVDILQFRTQPGSSAGEVELYTVELPPAFVYDVDGTAPNGPITNCDPRMLPALLYWSQFDWAPSIPIIRRTDGGESGILATDFMSYLCDIDNYSFIDVEHLRNIHEACLLSMLTNKDYPTNNM